jgi:hypothetical protein
MLARDLIGFIAIMLQARNKKSRNALRALNPGPPQPVYAEPA